MVSYAKHVSTKTTPQTQPIPGAAQVANSAGGFVWQVDKWARLDRFLFLGSEGGSYYATEQKLTVENATSIAECLKEDGKRVVARIVEISDAGRAPKNDPAIFVLAMAASVDNHDTKQAAFAALPKVARIGTHLFHFVREVTEMRGWGRALKRAVGKWYTDRDPADLARMLVKYQQRDGWSNRDLLRLSKPQPPSLVYRDAFRWACGKPIPANEAIHSSLAMLGAFDAAKVAADARSVVKLVRNFDLPRECVPTTFLNDIGVWDALLDKMPLTAMIRNLGKMTSVGLLKPLSVAEGFINAQLGNVDLVRRARVHPITILAAMKTYAQGHGEKGSLKWEPVAKIIDALDAAFYLAFQNVVPTNKRWLLALDVSGSMSWAKVSGIPCLTAREASAALSLVTASVESRHHIMGFGQEFVPLSISPRQRLTDAVREISDLPFGATDCSLPMLWALQRKVAVDAFVVFTDSETFFGAIHPSQALAQYRREMGIPAKLIVNAMVANPFTIADPNDVGMLDVVGFDSSTPAVMSEFVR